MLPPAGLGKGAACDYSASFGLPDAQHFFNKQTPTRLWNRAFFLPVKLPLGHFQRTRLEGNALQIVSSLLFFLPTRTS